MTYRIVCDSCCDFTATERLDPRFVRVPLTIDIGEKHIVDDETFVQLTFLEDMAAYPEAPKSACPSIDRYLQSFDCDADMIFGVTLSAELSGSYNAAFQARTLYLEEHPGAKIHIFNSRSASSGELVVARKIHELAEAGKTYEEIINAVEHYISEMDTLFVLENLEVLRKNGRLSTLQAVVTGTLHIKLLMGSTPEGTICKHGQGLSIKQTLSKLAARVAERCAEKDMSQKILVIAHCACLDRAKYVSDLIRKSCNFREIVITTTGGISSMYANDGGVIVAY
jgi:DegV family protein with EDD domain